MRRLDRGAPIREAMKAAGLDIPHLAAKTREVDETGAGLSKSLVGHIVGGGKTAREDCSDRAAELIAAALEREVSDLFTQPEVMLRESTSTPRSKTRGPQKPLPEQLMDQKGLAAFLRKSSSWIDKQIQITAELPESERFPVEYAGRSRRFNPYAVLDHLRKQRQKADAVPA